MTATIIVFVRKVYQLNVQSARFLKFLVILRFKLGEHIFHYNYLKKYYDQLFLYLMKMFHLKNETVCCFLHQEYQLKGQDWCTGGHGVVRFLTVFI